MQINEFFDRLAADYNQAIHRCFPRYSEMLKILLSYLPQELHRPRILELGCGTGNLSEQLVEHYPSCEITLVDLSADSLESCRQRLGDAQFFHYRHQDMRELEFETSSFDLILSTIAIHHLTSLEKQELFANCHRWLRPGGTFSFADQFAAENEAAHAQHMRAWQQISLAAGASQDEWDAWMTHQDEHDHHDKLSQQLDWLTTAGFMQADALWRYLLWTIVQAQKAAR